MSGVDELVRWLGEQLDEDERTARAADPDLSNLTSCIEVEYPEIKADEVHALRHDPARVLAEINAKRQLLEAYEQAVSEYAADGRAYDHDSEIGRERTCALGEAVRFAASAYSTRPGYAEAVASAG